jgi:nucleoid-associated protein YgaU
VGLVTVVVMAPGETIYSLAAQAYGTPEPGWRRILDANNISDPRDVVPGMALRVP